MRSITGHDFRQQPQFKVKFRATSFLVLVDCESYPPLAGKKPDRLDLLQHICAQLDALTATMWEVPAGMVDLELIWTPNGLLGERLARGGRRSFADGYLRTSGRLRLASDDELLEAAIRKTGLELPASMPMLLVPPGVYTVSVLNGHALDPSTAGQSSSYTVLLRHSPHPPPRLHPVRLCARSTYLQERAAADRPSEACESHKSPA